MKVKLFKGFIFAAFSLMFCSSIFAQDKSTTVKALALTVKVPVIVVGETAKIAYKTTKFTTKEIVWPAAKVTLKPLVLKVAPDVSLFLLKEAGKTAVGALPVGSKLLVKYLMFQLAVP